MLKPLPKKTWSKWITPNNTRILWDMEQDKYVVELHGTPVVSFDPKLIKLNDGGYMTVTTKRRMNEASTYFGLGYRVFQHKRDWYVIYKGVIHDYHDGFLMYRL